MTSTRTINKILFVLFFVSGFCGLLYQTVWLRLALASFGVSTPVVSVVVSVFMLGLGLGSWLGGQYIERLCSKTGRSAITFYGLTELMIAAGAFAVPVGFAIGKTLLLQTGESNSLQYLFASAIVIAISILPWSTAMGTTFPFVMAFVEEFEDSDKRSFSMLYLANVAGAILGTIATVLVLVELLGFSKALMVAACFNLLIGTTGIFWGLRIGPTQRKIKTGEASLSSLPPHQERALISAILFTTGFVSMAMEVIWTRAFTQILGTLVYSFAQLLATYLLATCVGSYVYRRHCSTQRVRSIELPLAVAAICAFIPVLFGDLEGLSLAVPLHLPLFSLVLLSIMPFCAALGYLTPLLIDTISQGNPLIAGRAYALNVAGCIVGPLIAGYLLLPNLGSRLSLVVLALPLLIFVLLRFGKLSKPVQICTASLAIILLYLSLSFRSIEEGAGITSKIVLRRDYAATVVSAGEAMDKHLLVNGIGMTGLVPITKYMAHLPLAFLGHRPESALVICFGMGTTYRALLSWGIHVTAVELIPSVKDAFPYYFADANEVLKNPNGKIVVDDGRRFLARTKEKFDVITIDPPPPVEAAGSSLLYSKDFYKELKQHLQPGGILQQWFPGDKEFPEVPAVARSLVESFRYVKAFVSVTGHGYHFLASEQPIADLTTDQVAAKLPAAARHDAEEWGKLGFDRILSHQVDIKTLLGDDDTLRITDDRPYNEYFWLRNNNLLYKLRYNIRQAEETR